MKLDVAIVGGGISGLSAALYTGHAGLKTVVFDTVASQIKKVSALSNYLGTPGLSGDQLLEQFTKQIKDYAQLKQENVEGIQKEGDMFIVSTDKETYQAKRVIVATNVNTQLLEKLGFEIGINENIKSGKIKKVVGVNWEGITSIPNLYITGLLTGIPSQAMIAAGQGAAVGVRIAQEATGEKYMWHDK
ncbi:FAD-dependent oxidoreductase [Ectobacillus sp. sgz5001026]|uniref:NAD(P)/FAD-dependent oxidoreductase n=1 Tax=Ectobacillus sp. sgz5001026 TaxID=3242473 RepID=UPI0036D34F50